MAIRELATPKQDIVAFEAIGELSGDDYTKHIAPIFEKARKNGQKIRFLYYFGPEFKGFSPKAVWEDFKIGLKYLKTMQRCAVVSDLSWIINSSKMIGALIPCEVQTFSNDSLDSAMKWLDSGEIGADFQLDEKRGTLTLEIDSPLSSNFFEVVTDITDRWLEDNHSLKGLIIHAKEFPGWENLGTMISHFTFVKDHHKKINKVAMVGDGAFLEFGPKIGSHFVNAEIKNFAFDKLSEAKTWAASP